MKNQKDASSEVVPCSTCFGYGMVAGHHYPIEPSEAPLYRRLSQDYGYPVCETCPECNANIGSGPRPSTRKYK